MASIIKVDEIKSQANGSALSIASGGNVTNNGTFTSTGAITASGGIANAGTISAGTLGSSVVVPASIGGGEVLLDTHTANNDTATLEVDLTQYTTFETYRIRFVNWVPASDDKDFRMQVGTASNSMYTVYRTSTHRGQFNGSTTSDSNSSSTSYLLFAFGVGGPAVHEGVCLESFIYEPRNSTKRTRSLAQINLFDVSSYTRIYNTAGTSLEEQDDAYWHFTWESGVNTLSGKFYLYGVKNA